MLDKATIGQPIIEMESVSRIYQMGRDEIKWGSEDHWTFTPHEMERVQAQVAAANPAAAAPAGEARGGARGGGGRGGGGGAPLYAALRTKELRDSRGYVIPSNQDDFGSATRFVNALFKSGVTILRATAPFTVAGKQYPANSYVVKTAQAFRPGGTARLRALLLDQDGQLGARVLRPQWLLPVG